MNRPLALLALVLAGPLGSLAQPLPLSFLNTVDTGPVMDVAVDGTRAYAIGHGRLLVLDITEPAKPQVLGSLDGLGNTRQLAVSEGVAYVTARESGVYLVDVREAQPELITHYDSIELATGVAIAGKVLFVAHRHFGVELVDVTDPKRPRHLSTIRTGEAQSVFYHEGLLYTGVWGTSEVVTADVRDPRHPRIVSKVPLDGYGDGVFVHDGKLYAATGHHSRQPHRHPGDPGYGKGHGLEVFSLAEPAQPKFLGRAKFPPFYDIGNDMWDVQVAGKTAFVGDTHNGLFAVDVSEPASPRLLARYELPKPSAEAKHAGFVGGFALVKDHVYVAGGDTGLHILEAENLAHPLKGNPGEGPVIPPNPGPAGPDTYRPDGQVHAVAVIGDVAVVACGSAGLHTLRVGTHLTLLHQMPAKGVVTDVCVSRDRILAAEGLGGLSLWKLERDGKLTELGRYQVPGKPVKYVSAPDPGRFALLQVGSNTLHIVDISDPLQMRLALADKRPGLLYGYQLCDQLLAGRYAAAFWHVSGLHWYDLQGESPVFAGQHPPGRFDPLSGIALLDAQMIATRNGGLVRFGQAETRALDSLPVSRAGKAWLTGKPVVQGGHVALSNRALGEVFLLDAADLTQLEVLEKFDLEGNPGRVSFIQGGLLVPAGYQGLIRKSYRMSSAKTSGGRRDPWLWPFAANSIWNMPIGSGAIYQPADLGPAGHVGVDTQFLLRTSHQDPEQLVLESPSFTSRIGTARLDFRLRVPDDWTVPDVGKGNPYGLTPNANYAILLPDGVRVLQGSRICRPEPGGPVYLPAWMNRPRNREPVLLSGDGLGRIGQGASGMSTLGGTIRLGELIGDQPIRHAVKINPFAGRYCYYSQEVPGWRWPACRADAYAAKEYKGRNPAVVMGSLLAIQPETTPETLGLQTAPGRKLFHVLQDYGAYFTEDAHWDTWDLVVERDAEKEFEQTYGFSMKSPPWRDEVNRLVSALHVIVNNSPASIGGGGTPRCPLAPPLLVAPSH